MELVKKVEKLEEERRALAERPRKRRRTDGTSPTGVVIRPSPSSASGSARATTEEALDVDEDDIEEIVELSEREYTCVMNNFRF